MICNNGNVRIQTRGGWMAGNLATKQEYNVGWGFHSNNNTSASYEAETLVLSGFQAHEVCSYIGKPLKADEVRSYTLEYWLMPACHPAACCEQRADQSALTYGKLLKKCRQCLLRHPATGCGQYQQKFPLCGISLLKALSY